jgi:transcriptional regulator with XRE-family HTH domain
MELLVRNKAYAVDIHVGHHIRLARQMRKMTQGQLAELINLTFQQVQKYERGSNRVAVSTLVLIAQALDVPVTYFFEGLQSNATPADKSGTALSAEGWEIAALVTGISHRGLRRRLLSLAREVASIDAELNNPPE